MNANTPVELKEALQIETTQQFCTVRFRRRIPQLFAGGYNAQIHRWNLQGEKPEPLSPLEGHHGWVQSLLIDAEQDRLYSADSWGGLRGWQLGDGEPQQAWHQDQAHDGWIRCIALSSDGQMLATTGRDRRVRLWNTKDGQLVHELPDHGTLPIPVESDVSSSADPSKSDASGNAPTVAAANSNPSSAVTDGTAPLHEANEAFAVAFHPDGQTLVTADLHGTIRAWDRTQGKLIGQRHLSKLHLHERIQDVPGVRVLRFHDEGRMLVCAGGEPKNTGTVQAVPVLHLLAWPSLETQRTFHLGEINDGFVFDLAWHTAGYWAVVLNGTPGQGKLLLLRPGDEKPCFSSNKMSNCQSVDIDQTGRIVVSATNRNSQGNGAVRDKEGNYVGNTSPLFLFPSPSAPVAG